MNCSPAETHQRPWGFPRAVSYPRHPPLPRNSGLGALFDQVTREAADARARNLEAEGQPPERFTHLAVTLAYCTEPLSIRSPSSPGNFTCASPPCR